MSNNAHNKVAIIYIYKSVDELIMKMVWNIPGPDTENENYTKLWGFGFKSSREIIVNRPNIVVEGKSCKISIEVMTYHVTQI